MGGSKRLVPTLLPDIAAPILIVMHIGQMRFFPEILSAAGPLPARHATHQRPCGAGCRPAESQDRRDSSNNSAKVPRTG